MEETVKLENLNLIFLFYFLICKKIRQMRIKTINILT